MAIYEQPLTFLIRARRAAEAQSILDCDRDGFLNVGFLSLVRSGQPCIPEAARRPGEGPAQLA